MGGGIVNPVEYRLAEDIPFDNMAAIGFPGATSASAQLSFSKGRKQARLEITVHGATGEQYDNYDNRAIVSAILSERMNVDTTQQLPEYIRKKAVHDDFAGGAGPDDVIVGRRTRVGHDVDISTIARVPWQTLCTLVKKIPGIEALLNKLGRGR